MEKFEIPEDFKEMAKDLIEIYELAYKQLKPTVNYIIKNEIKDPSFIESVLDNLLNIPTDKCYKLFIKLCDYYKEIKPRVTKEYLDLYDELYGEEEIKKL